MKKHEHRTTPTPNCVTAAQLTMQPGQTLQQKAKELGCSLLTLRLWTAEWRGSGYDPDYVIPRAGHDNWLKNQWKSKDWTEALRQQIAKQHHRHVGDLLLEVGLTGSNAQLWSQKHAEFAKVLWAEPHPKKHWPDFIAYVRHAVIEDYRKRKAAHLAAGMEQTEAMHRAADEAVNELKHKTRQRRRVERDILYGVGAHEERLAKHRKGAKLTDAHARRIGKKLFKVARWATMERALREVGYPEDYIKEQMKRLTGAFTKSETSGQAQWKKTREAVLRRRGQAERWEKAEEVERDIIPMCLRPLSKSKHTASALGYRRDDSRH